LTTRTLAGGRRRGATVLELAFTCPVTILLLVGILDTGLALHSNNALAEASREGARFAAVHGSKSGTPFGPSANDASLEQAVRKSAIGLNPESLQVSSTWPDSNNNPNSRVTVQLTYTYRPVGLLGAPYVIRNSSTMIIYH